MTTTRPELTLEHRRLFRDFVRLVYEMDQCRFVRQYRQQDHTVSCRVDDDGEAMTTAPDYDWDDFRSFMTIFRKVGIAVNEPTYLSKIYNLIGQYASDALRQRLGTDRQQVMAMLTGTWTGMQVRGKIGGKEVTFSIAELLDMVTNGMVFHEDPRHRQAVEMFAKAPRWNYLWPTIVAEAACAAQIRNSSESLWTLSGVLFASSNSAKAVMANNEQSPRAPCCSGVRPNLWYSGPRLAMLGGPPKATATVATVKNPTSPGMRYDMVSPRRRSCRVRRPVSQRRPSAGIPAL